MKGDLPDIVKGCKELLASNVVDEENHDIALNFAAEAHKIPTKFREGSCAAFVRMHGLNLDRHPVLKAVVLERSVFFVLLPIFRFLGDTGLRTTSQQISPVMSKPMSLPTHLVCEANSVLNLTKTLNNLRTRYGRVGAFSPSRGRVTHKHLSSVTSGLQVQIALYTRGKAEGLIEHTQLLVCLRSLKLITLTCHSMPSTKIQVFEEGICPDTFDDTQLPTDIHIVTFTKDGVRQFDAVRAYSKD